MENQRTVSCEAFDSSIKELCIVLFGDGVGHGVSADTLEIALEALDVAQTLVRKNVDYGSSAFDPPLLANHLGPGAAILVRMSDKLRRIQHFLREGGFLVSESYSDCYRDLAGYAILMLVLLKKERASIEATPKVSG